MKAIVRCLDCGQQCTVSVSGDGSSASTCCGKPYYIGQEPPEEMDKWIKTINAYPRAMAEKELRGEKV